MKPSVSLDVISAKQTHLVRHPMLRKGRPLDSCVFEGDDLETSLHLGAFHNEQLVGVASAYSKNHSQLLGESSYQIRGVAVLAAFQGQQIGRTLMDGIEQHLYTRNTSLLWLNARTKAVPFYKALHYVPFGEAFDIPLIGQHYCYFKRLRA